MEITLVAFKKLEEDLKQFPDQLFSNYRQALYFMQQVVSSHDLLTWAQHGLSIASKRDDAWLAASEYFRVSPGMASRLNVVNLNSWARCGESLCEDDSTMGLAYFQVSYDSVQYLDPRQIPGWSQLGHKLYGGTRKSNVLVNQFFYASPILLRVISYSELERLTNFIDGLAKHSVEFSNECLTLSTEILPEIVEGRESLISLLNSVTDENWRDVKVCFESGANALPRIEHSQKGRFIDLTERLMRTGYKGIPAFLSEGSRALGQVQSQLHGLILTLCEALLIVQPSALPEFLKSSPNILSRISPQQLEVWFGEGVRILRENREGGLAYFRLESSRAEEIMNNLSAIVELPRIKDVLRMYCRALAGSKMEVASTQELVQRGIGWVSAELPTTEGSTVYLPPKVDRYETKDENFGLFKVVSTHQVAHLEYGSFEFGYDIPSTKFSDLRPLMTPTRRAREEVNGGNVWITDMHRLFALFDDGKLALDIFTVLEDGRLDALVMSEYAGIRAHYRRVQNDSVNEREPITNLPGREAMVEFLVRLSLRPDGKLQAPTNLAEKAKKIGRIASKILSMPTTVEDVAEATLRIYAIIIQIPNESTSGQEWDDIDPSEFQSDEFENGDDYQAVLESRLEQLQEGVRAEEETDSLPYNSPEMVEFRGDFKPGLVQLLNRLRNPQQDDDPGVSPFTREELSQMLEESPEIESDQSQETVSQSLNTLTNKIMSSAGMAAPPPPQTMGQGPFVHVDEEGGPLEATEPNTQVYPEWDFRANDYKPRWCIVRDKPMLEGDLRFWYQTLRENVDLVDKLRRQFEMVMPETFRKIRPLPDGEDLDLDAVIEAMVDRRIGVSPSEKVYWRRNKIQRDVAVLLLLDMSASTAEAIDESRRDEWDAPSDPVEYMLWLRTRRLEASRRSYKRIIDLEKESIVLLIQALETLGDQYGIYGFSGYGRENVEFYIIKSLQEVLSEGVRKRIDKINPLHATRMGPAIRHATTQLLQVEAKTKFLFLISDGRPQDRGYSREGVEKEYAIQDTHMALVESRRHGITPFCLTVDRAGHDYLKAMCGDMGYEVLTEISSLPQRLPELYKNLTA